MRRLVLLTALAACGGDHPSRRDRAPEVEVDPRFGAFVDVPIPILGSTIVGAAGKGGVDFMGVWTDAGLDDRMNPSEEEFHIYRIDPDDGFSVREIDLPEIIDRDFYLWHAFQPDQALITFPTVLFAYDGEEWVYIDPPPELVHADAGYVLLDEDRLFGQSYDQIAVWDGSSWRTVPVPAGSVLGPLERDRFRTVHPGPCTILWDFATLASEPEICASGGAEPYWSVNGDGDSFHVFDANYHLRRFTDGAWPEASEAPYDGFGLVTTNAPDRVLMTTLRDDLRVAELRAVDQGASDEVLFPATDPTIECECDRGTDPECGCVNPQIAWSHTVIAADGQTQDLFLALDVNGVRELHVRRFQLPVAALPFSAEDIP